VDRPQTTKALTVDLLSAVSAASGIPKNYALEVTPYWLVEHPTLTFDDYFVGRDENGRLRGYQPRDLGWSLVRSFAVSVATAPIDASDPTKGTQLALGTRAMLVPGRANKLLDEYRRRLVALDQQASDELGRGLAALEVERKRYTAKIDQTTGSTRDAWRVRLKVVEARIDQRKADMKNAPKATPAEIADRQAQAKKLTARVSELDAQRDGFMLTVAEGQAWSFANDLTAEGQFTRASVWVTPAYRVRPCEPTKDDDTVQCESSIDLIGVLRYTSDRTMMQDPSRWDVGGRIAWQINKQLALSAEAVQRSRPLSSMSTDPTHRAVGILEYRVTDGTLFFASFGQDFANGSDQQTLVSLLGLNFGLGKKPLIDFSK
jgi:hypothetical protein